MHPDIPPAAAIYMGYFTEPGDTPAYDPGLTAPCPCCGLPVGTDCTTPSLMYIADATAVIRAGDGGRAELVGIVPLEDRSYFYRAHRACYHALTPTEQTALDNRMLDLLEDTPRHAP